MPEATLQTTAATCCYCGVGCGVLIEHDGEKILGVQGDPSHPANFGRLCSKGSSLHLTGDLDARALYPEQLDGCAPSFEYALQNYGLPKFLGAIFIRDQDCGVIDWTFLGLSMPAWVLIWFAVLVVVLVWAGFRRTR